MKRHAKKLQHKASENTVLEHRGNLWVVQSSTSDEEYMIYQTGGRLSCHCDWSKYNPNKRCTHRLTVTQEAAKEQGKKVYFWDNLEDVKRQHKRFVEIEPGLYMTIEPDYSQRARGQA